MELENLCIELDAYLNRYYRPERKRQTQEDTNVHAFVPLFNYEKELSKYINENLDEDFSRKLLRMISERKLTNPEVYKKADMTKQKFSRLISTGRAKKEDIFILAFALKLTLTELNELLGCAGFLLSPASKTDLIVRFCFEKEVYDLCQVNELLYKFNGDCLFCE